MNNMYDSDRTCPYLNRVDALGDEYYFDKNASIKWADTSPVSLL